MTKKEQILEGLKNAPSTEYGEYKYAGWLTEVICKVMGYQIIRRIRFADRFANEQDMLNCNEIIRRMEAKGYITFSKSRMMFKLNEGRCAQ